MARIVLLSVIARIPGVAVEMQQHGLRRMVLLEACEILRVLRLATRHFFIEAFPHDPRQAVEGLLPNFIVAISATHGAFRRPEEEGPGVLLSQDVQLLNVTCHRSRSDDRECDE